MIVANGVLIHGVVRVLLITWSGEHLAYDCIATVQTPDLMIFALHQQVLKSFFSMENPLLSKGLIERIFNIHKVPGSKTSDYNQPRAVELDCKTTCPSGRLPGKRGNSDLLTQELFGKGMWTIKS